MRPERRAAARRRYFRGRLARIFGAEAAQKLRERRRVFEDTERAADADALAGRERQIGKGRALSRVLRQRARRIELLRGGSWPAGRRRRRNKRRNAGRACRRFNRAGRRDREGRVTPSASERPSPWARRGPSRGRRACRSARRADNRRPPGPSRARPSS
jgi:hypothetical protein